MISRGVEPIADSARTNSSTVAPCFSTTVRAFSSLADTVVCGVTSVVPADSGFGCDTISTVFTSTLRLPCRMATGDIRTSFPRTIVPVRSFTTTRAALSASTSRFSNCAMNSMVRAENSGGTETVTSPAFSA